MRVFLLALLTAAASAQPMLVPLDRALALAGERSAEVLRAGADALGAQASLAQARTSRWPAVSASMGAGQRYGLAFDQTTGALTQATVEALDVGLSASAVLYDGGARRARVRSAEASLAAVRAGGDVARRRAEVEVVNGYLEVAQAEAAETVARAEVEAQERLLAEVEDLIAFGVRPASDLPQQRERLAAARGSVLDAERARALAEVRLVSLLGLDPASDYVFPPPAEVPEPEPVEALVARAVEARPDVRAALADVLEAEAGVSVAAAGRRPEVALVSGVGTGFTSAGVGGVPGQFGDNRAGQVGVQVSLPVFDRGASRADVGRAQARASAARAAADEARRAVALDVRQSAIVLADTEAQLALAAVRVEAADAALNAETARYQAGETTLQSVALLRARAVDAATRLAVLAVTARYQRVLLRLAAGG